MVTFPHLSPAAPDPIFRITAEAQKAGPKAINGTIGMFMDEEGNVLTFESVRKAMHDVEQALPAMSFGYGSLLGVPEFRESVHQLIRGNTELHIASVATTGGTGAVALSLRLASVISHGVTAILPAPAYVNHPRLCAAAGIPIHDVQHVKDGRASINGILGALKTISGPACVILQSGCHNPTGLEYTPEQWTELLTAMKEKNAIALIDIAYQGFAGTFEEDAAPILRAAEMGVTTIFAWSASKNHSLYSERVGLAGAVVPDASTKEEVEAHFSILTRWIHSASARMGQLIVARTQSHHQTQWLQEMDAARAILKQKRAVLSQALPENLRPFVNGNGMFAQLPLSSKQLQTLRTDHLVFLADGGRMNIASIPLSRLEELAEKIQKVRER